MDCHGNSLDFDQSTYMADACDVSRIRNSFCLPVVGTAEISFRDFFVIGTFHFSSSVRGITATTKSVTTDTKSTFN